MTRGLSHVTPCSDRTERDEVVVINSRYLMTRCTDIK